MMDLSKVFSRLVVNIYDVDHAITYKCPCDKQIGFKFRDLEKHWNNNYSNLDKKDFVGAPDGQSFIDFYCPSCHLSTTIQYDLSAGGQHGEFWYTIKNLVMGIKS